MEGSASTLKQLKIITWFVALIAIGILTAAGAVGYYSYLVLRITESSLNESFRDKASSLVDENKLDEAVKLSNERIKTHPNDENAYWYRGLSYYLQEKWQPAIDDFNKVEALAPSWKTQYVEPYRTAALSKQKNR